MSDDSRGISILVHTVSSDSNSNNEEEECGRKKTNDADDDSGNLEISSEPSEEPSECENDASASHKIIDENPNIVSMEIDLRDADDDCFSEDEIIECSYNDEIHNPRDRMRMSTEMLPPLEPPIQTAADQNEEVDSFRARDISRRDSNSRGDVASTKQQAPLDRPEIRIEGKNENSKNENERSSIANRKMGPEKQREEDDEEKKRNEFMQWRREGIPEHIFFEFGKDDCPTDEESESKRISKTQKQAKSKPQHQPTRRRFPPPPPPSGTKATLSRDSQQTWTKGTCLPSNARDLSGSNHQSSHQSSLEEKPKVIYRRFLMRSKNATNEGSNSQDSIKPRPSKSQSPPPPPTVPVTHNKTDPQSIRKRMDSNDGSADNNHGNKQKPTTRTGQRLSRIKKIGSKKIKEIKNLRTLLGKGNSEKRDSANEKSKQEFYKRGHHSAPVIAVSLTRGRSQRALDINGVAKTASTTYTTTATATAAATKTRRRNGSGDNSIDENPFATTATTSTTKTRRRNGSRDDSIESPFVTTPASKAPRRNGSRGNGSRDGSIENPFATTATTDNTARAMRPGGRKSKKKAAKSSSRKQQVSSMQMSSRSLGMDSVGHSSISNSRRSTGRTKIVRRQKSRSRLDV